MNGPSKIQRWKVFTSRTIVMFMIQGIIRSASVILEETVAEFNTSIPLAGWAFTLLAGLTFLSAPFVQLVLKIFSYRTSSVLGGILFTVGIMYIGLFATNVWQLFVCVIVAGIGSGTVALPSFIALRDAFETSFGTVNSATLLVSNVSGFVLPLLVEYWKTLYGFRPTILLIGAMGLHFVLSAVCLPSSSVTREPVKEKKQPPLNTGQKDAGVTKFLYRAHPSLLTLNVFLTIALIQLVGVSTFLYPYGLSKGFENRLCAVIVSMSGVGSLFGRFLTISLYQWNLTGSPSAVVSPYIIFLAMQMWSIVSSNGFVIVIMAFFAGVVAGQSTAWATSVVKDLSCTVHFSSAVTWLSFWGGIGSTFGGLITGWTHEIRGSYDDVMLFLLLLSLLEITLIFLTLCSKQSTDYPKTNE